MADSETGIAIDLEVMGTDRALSDLRKIAAEFKKVHQAMAGAGSGSGAAQAAAFNPNVTRQFAVQQSVQRSAVASASATAKATVSIQQVAAAAAVADLSLAALGAEFVAAGAVIGTAAVAFYAVAKAATDAGAALASIALTSGGNAQESAQLSVFGNALGVNMAEMARQFADRISRGGAAGGFAAMHGVSDFGVFDSTDKAQKLLKWMKVLRGLSSTEALRAARETGTEGLLASRSYTQKTMNNLDRDAGIRSQILDPKFLEDSINFGVAVGRVTQAFENLMSAVIKPLVPGLTKFFDELAESLNHAALSVDANQNKVLGLVKVLQGVLEAALTFELGGALGWQDIFEGIKQMMEPSSASDRRATAIDRNTEALNGLSYQMRDGIYGGGERARGAVPSRWLGRESWYYVRRAATLGAFNL